MSEKIFALSAEIAAKVQEVNLHGSVSNAKLTRLERIRGGLELAPKGIVLEESFDGDLYVKTDKNSGVCVNLETNKIYFAYDRATLGPVKNKSDREGLRQDGFDKKDFEAFTEKTLNANPELKSVLVGYQYGSKTVTEDSNGTKIKQQLQK